MKFFEIFCLHSETEVVEWREFTEHFDLHNSAYFRRKRLNIF